jgi:4-diphosphocytidyl-2-C-methyl-D-erythritol kinase
LRKDPLKDLFLLIPLPHYASISVLSFPVSKINLGLHVIEKRPDGFHNIETIFYPIRWFDSVEIVENVEYKKGQSEVIFTASGLPIPGTTEENLCVKAYQLLRKQYTMPPVKIHLHKIIPMGAGLGGGSSDAAAVIKLLDNIFQLNMKASDMLGYARQLGSDCAFFIQSQPVFAKGKGDEFEPVQVNLSGHFIGVNTAEAYARLTPKTPAFSLKERITTLPLESWKDQIVNDFEESVFHTYPQLRKMKDKLYQKGAIYASMSGSGSALFGIFKKQPFIQNFFNDVKAWEGPAM